MNLNLLNKMKTRIYDEVLFRQNEELINNKDIMNNRFLFAPLLHCSLSLSFSHRHWIAVQHHQFQGKWKIIAKKIRLCERGAKKSVSDTVNYFVPFGGKIMKKREKREKNILRIECAQCIALTTNIKIYIYCCSSTTSKV